MSKAVARDPIYRRRRFQPEIIELCVKPRPSTPLSHSQTNFESRSRRQRGASGVVGPSLEQIEASGAGNGKGIGPQAARAPKSLTSIKTPQQVNSIKTPQ